MTTIKRILTSIVLTLIVSSIILLGDFYYIATVSLISLLCYNEMSTIKQFSNKRFLNFFGYFFIIAVYFVFFKYETQVISIFSKQIIYISICLIMVSVFEIIKKSLLTIKNIYFNVFYSIVFICLTIPYAMIIRFDQNGYFDILFIIAIISVVDSSAYFSGKLIGQRKLNSISPNKTIEGTIFGISTGVITGTIIIVLTNNSFETYLPLCILISIICPLGDLHESLVKRSFNVKDSSNLLPGHGGIYDRLDGYIFIFPIFYFSKKLILLLC